MITKKKSDLEQNNYVNSLVNSNNNSVNDINDLSNKLRNVNLSNIHTEM